MKNLQRIILLMFVVCMSSCEGIPVQEQKHRLYFLFYKDGKNISSDILKNDKEWDKIKSFIENSSSLCGFEYPIPERLKGKHTFCSIPSNLYYYADNAVAHSSLFYASYETKNKIVFSLVKDLKSKLINTTNYQVKIKKCNDRKIFWSQIVHESLANVVQKCVDLDI